jgi:hypothetical protein
MSFFLLPKNNNNNISIRGPFYPEKNLSSVTINTLHYYSLLQRAIQDIISKNTSLQKTGYTCYDIMNMSNPYEYLYRVLPGLQFSISKLKSISILLYDLIEINSLLDLFGSLKETKMNILNIGAYHKDFEYYINMIRGSSEDEIASFSSVCQDIKELNKKYNFIFIEDETNNTTKIDSHFQNIINILCVTLNNLDIEGNCLIKINNVFYNPLIEMLYLFSSLFEKVYIVKPSTSNVTTFEKYIFCKKFSGFEQFDLLDIETTESNEYNGKKVFLSGSILEKEVPCFFLNKIQDSNSVLVQQQLEAMEQIINIFKMKNAEEKLDILKKTNIQKSCAWCEKYKIPYNKISEKVNIFLPLSNESESNELKQQEN